MDANLETLVNFGKCLLVAGGIVLSSLDIFWTTKIDLYGLKPDSKYFNLGFSGYAAWRENGFKDLRTSSTAYEASKST